MKHFYDELPGQFCWEVFYTDIVKNADPGSVFVEVDCWKGKSTAFLAVEILNSGKPIDLYCVNQWAEKSDKSSTKPSHREFLKNLDPVKSRINIIKTSPLEAAFKFKVATVDFVMLGSVSGFDQTNTALRAWSPRMKPGGIIAGRGWGIRGTDRAVKARNDVAEVIGKGRNSIWMIKA